MKAFAGVHGWNGWQWLFLLEGVPSVLLGVWTLFYLDDGIRGARWLSESDKRALEREIAADRQQQQHRACRQPERDSRRAPVHQRAGKVKP